MPRLSNLKMILATDKLGAIGYQGKLPWKNAAEMQYFKSITMGENIHLIVSENTLNSIPNRLRNGRKAIYIITRDPAKIDKVEDGYYHYVSYYQMMDIITQREKENPEDVFFVIGGKVIYTLCENDVSMISHSLGSFIADNADTYYFPDITGAEIHVVGRLSCGVFTVMQYTW